MEEPTTVYTDGACIGNPGPGGWAWAVPGGRFGSGAHAHTTNQRMEITAVLEALRSIEGAIDIVSDSTYVVNCFRDHWWEGWVRRGWLNSQRKPVANRDLWEPLLDLYLERGGPDAISFRWVKGHGEDLMNDLVDRLAVEAAREQAGRTGTGTPEDLGAPDAPGANGNRDRRLPTAHTILVTGAKPPQLGGYEPNALARAVVAKLTEILDGLRVVHGDVAVLTGLSLGAEQLAATAALAAGVPYVAALPFPGQEAVWSGDTQTEYKKLLDGAAAQLVFETKAPQSKQQAGATIGKRDAWLAKQADEAIVVWDGADTNVSRVIESLRDRLGDEQVWVVDVSVLQ